MACQSSHPCPNRATINWVNRCVLWVLIGSAAVTRVNAAGAYFPTSARAGGMGDTFTAAATGVEAIGWNPAGVAWSTGTALRLGYDRPFGLAALEHRSGAFGYGRGRYGAGVSVTGFGDSGYRETTLHTVIAVRPRRGVVGVGIGGRLIAVGGVDIGSQAFAVFDIGLRIAGENWAIGTVGWNAAGHRVEALSQGTAAGIAMGVTPRVTVSLDIWKEVGIKTGASTGVEVVLHRRLIGRLGWGGIPDRLSVGFGIEASIVRIDVSVSHHSILGRSHRLSMVVR